MKKLMWYLEILPAILPCSPRRFETRREELESRRKKREKEGKTEGNHGEENMIYTEFNQESSE